MDLLEKIFGSKNQRKLKKIKPLVKTINELEEEFSKYDDSKLRDES